MNIDNKTYIKHTEDNVNQDLVTFQRKSKDNFNLVTFTPPEIHQHPDIVESREC